MVGPSLNTHNLSLKPNAAAINTVKFLCSYGGRILPRYPDGMLRYHGGQTRVLAVDRSISFSELLVKLVEMCGTSVSLRCQLPSEDLDALVSITSDEDLANLIEEYDRLASSSSKIRAFLSTPKSVKKISPPPSTTTTAASPKSSSIYSIGSPSKLSNRCVHQIAKPVTSPYPYLYPYPDKLATGKVQPYRYYQGNPSRHVYLVHNGNHWQ